MNFIKFAKRKNDVVSDVVPNAIKNPFLSYNDVRVLFAAKIMEKYDNKLFDNRIKQMKKRQQQRVRDIMRYYKFDLSK